MTVDPRLVLARPDLASRALQGLAPADAYADPRRMVCAAPAAAVRKAPDPAAEQVDELLFGEAFDLMDEAGGFAWGQARRDGYVGFVERVMLAPAGPAPSHRLAALGAYALAAPDVKAPALGRYALNSLLTVESRDGRFLKAAGAGWFAETQLSPVGVFETDPVDVAGRFLGAPYRWGGRDSRGVDCSGLVQQALFACGRACPRDTDQQAAVLAAPAEAAARGVLVFWEGHVAIALDAARILHANAHHMAVAVEPLAEAVARIEAAGGGRPTSLGRL